MRKSFLILILIMVLTAAGCGSTPPAASVSPAGTPSPVVQPLILTISCAGTCEESLKSAIKKDISDIKALSGGRLVIKLKENEGTDAEVLQSVEKGDSSIYIGNTAALEDIIKPLAVCDIPMLFPDKNACNAMLSKSFIDLMQPYIGNPKLQLIGAYCPSMSVLTSNKPISTADDIKSLRLRTGSDKYEELLWKTAGCFTTSLDWPNVYTALKKNLVEAQESTDEIVNGYKFYEVQKYMVKTNHLPEINLIIINKALYGSLSAQDSEWLNKFITQLTADAIAAGTVRDTDLESSFSKSGMQISEAPDGVKTGLNACVQPVIDLVKQTVDPSIVNGYLKACGQDVAEDTNASPTVSASPTGH